MKRKLSDAIGEERWAQVQRSSIKEKIRNCAVGDVTIEELLLMQKLFNMQAIELTQILLSEKPFKVYKVEEDFGSEEEWIEGMPIPKRD